MTHHSRGPAGRWLLTGSVLFLAGCGEAMGVGSPSTFTADVRGAMNERITGSATAGADNVVREFAGQVTLPGGTTFSMIALVSDGRTLSFTRPGTELPTGTHKLGMIGAEGGFPKGGFSGGYAVRKSNGIQLFMSDSGSITISESGSRVVGSFVLYASEYVVLPPPSPDQVGKPITPLETGSAPLTISGTFAAVRREAR